MKNIAAPIDGTFNATAALTLDSIKGLVAFAKPTHISDEAA